MRAELWRLGARGGEEESEEARRIVCSPGARNRRRGGVGRSRAAAIELGARRPERRKERVRRRVRAPRLDSFGGEGEDDEAEPTVASIRAGAAGVDGGVLGSHGGGDERELDLGLGFRGTRGERVEEREGSR